MDDYDPVRERRERWTALAAGLAWLVTAPLLGVALLRLLAHDATMELVVLNAMTPWLYLPAWCSLAIGLVFQRWTLARAAGVVACLHVLWLDPRGLIASPEPRPGPGAVTLRVMSANLLMVNDDLEGISGEIMSNHPDLLLVQELTPSWMQRFEAPEVRAILPHRVGIPQADSFGIGIYSRLPASISQLDLSGLPALRAELIVSGKRLSVLNVHTLPPRTPLYTRTWNQMMSQVCELVRSEPGPLLLAGDLNATSQARWYRELQALALRGAHEDRGRGLAVTWPNGLMPYPPIRLDHLLVSPQIQVLEVSEGVGRGSDHRPIIASIALR
jgi:endonuclease/exonuclease/phosphatase (EEP) superfamily protein YafD